MASRLTIFLSAPALLGLALVGCPKKQPPTDAGPATSASPSISVVAPEASVAAPEAAPPIVEDLLEDATTGDADATDGDAADARVRPDANEDAPLFGTKTFMDETPMKGFRRITASAAKVRKAPKDGEIIATLPKGSDVSLVAEIFNWYRVRFTDPVTQQRRQGWIYITTVAGPRMKTCPPGWTSHPEDNGWCDKECTKNADCKALKGYKCSGTLCFYAAD
ncbi:MAG: SH3 domain-containing protein [Myxococcales bacterium]|nr:SH3 domain-containing protein [Myxococcales bacterium]